MTDNTMREGKLWAFLHDSIHEAYKKLSTTGTSNEYHALLDSIASKVTDDVDARFLQVAQSAQSVPVVGEPVAWVIVFEDTEARNEVFIGEGAEAAARHRHKQVLLRWNCHLLTSAPTNSIPAAELATLREKAAEADELRKDAEKRDAREDRHWRAGFMDGWNAGVIGDESALKAAGERLVAAIAQGKGGGGGWTEDGQRGRL